MVVCERAVLISELVPEGDGRLDDFGLGSSTLPLFGKVFSQQGFDYGREVWRDFTDVLKKVFIERQINRALSRVYVVTRLHVLNSISPNFMRMACA
jgi:hypothetical protein